MTSLSNPTSVMSQVTTGESQSIDIFGSENNFSLNNYNKINQNGIHFKTSFELKNIPVAMANALRRVCSSLCPTVTFDDSYQSKSIIVSNMRCRNTVFSICSSSHTTLIIVIKWGSISRAWS